MWIFQSMQLVFDSFNQMELNLENWKLFTVFKNSTKEFWSKYATIDFECKALQSFYLLQLGMSQTENTKNKHTVPVLLKKI